MKNIYIITGLIVILCLFFCSDDALSDNASEAPSEATTVLFRRHAPRTLEERRRALNTLFGFQPWNPHVSKKEIPSQLYDAPDESKTRPQSESTSMKILDTNFS